MTNDPGGMDALRRAALEVEERAGQQPPWKKGTLVFAGPPLRESVLGRDPGAPASGDHCRRTPGCPGRVVTVEDGGEVWETCPACGYAERAGAARQPSADVVAVDAWGGVPSSGRASVYLASSWRHERQPAVLAALREDGYRVYDFRAAAASYDWRRVDSDRPWSPSRARAALDHGLARAAYHVDRAAMEVADACVLLTPAGLSAGLEAGWFVGRGRPLFVLALGDPELMTLLACDRPRAPGGVYDTVDALLRALSRWSGSVG